MAKFEYFFAFPDAISLVFSLGRSKRARYGWVLQGAQRNKSSLNSEYIKAIHQTKPLPLTFHYVSPQQIREIHQEFQGMRSSFRPRPRRLTENESEVEYDSQLACFIAKERWRRAQSDSVSLPVSGTCAEASG